MNNQQATKRPASAPTTNRSFINTRTEVIAPGVTIHWANSRPDRVAEAQSEKDRKFFRDFGPRYTKRHPGPQARG